MPSKSHSTNHGLNRFILGFFLFMVLQLLAGCRGNLPNEVTVRNAGPQVLCPRSHQGLIYRTSNSATLAKFSSCYDYGFQELQQKGLIGKKIQWLRYADPDSLENFLSQASQMLSDNRMVALEWIKLLMNKKKYNQALIQLDRLEVEVNHPLRLLVEAHTGVFSVGSDLTKLPASYRHALQNIQSVQSLVKTNPERNFSLQRIDISAEGTRNAEPSITISNDGQTIWAVWIDDSGPISSERSSWRLRSARSLNGGVDWENDEFSPYPEETQSFHFDPMTSYDAVNNIMYSAGLTVNYSLPDDPSSATYYVYRWLLDTNTIEGPFRHFERRDKGWMVNDQNGRIWASYLSGGIEISDDGGESFTNLGITESTDTVSPQPRVDNNNCIHIIYGNDLFKCNNLGSISPVSSLPVTSLDFIEILDLLPGSFNAIPMTLMAIHPN